MSTEHIDVHEEHHPSQRKYVLIAAILAAITGAEVGVFYVQANPALIVWTLLLTSLVKFMIVVGFFMHLKFDDRRFALLFFFPLFIMVSLVVALLAMFLNLTR